MTIPVLKSILFQGRGDVVIIAEPDRGNVTGVEPKHIAKFLPALEQCFYGTPQVDVQVADDWKAAGGTIRYWWSSQKL